MWKLSCFNSVFEASLKTLQKELATDDLVFVPKDSHLTSDFQNCKVNPCTKCAIIFISSEKHTHSLTYHFMDLHDNPFKFLTYVFP